MQIVYKDDEILAEHDDTVDIDLVAMYPTATGVKTVNNSIDPYKAGTGLEGEEVQEFKTMTELGLQPEDEKVVRFIDGGKISQETVDELANASTIAALRTVLQKILLGTP